MQGRLDNIPVVNLGFVIDGQSTVDGCAVENDDFYSNNRHIKSHPKRRTWWLLSDENEFFPVLSLRYSLLPCYVIIGVAQSNIK